MPETNHSTDMDVVKALGEHFEPVAMDESYRSKLLADMLNNAVPRRAPFWRMLVFRWAASLVLLCAVVCSALLAYQAIGRWVHANDFVVVSMNNAVTGNESSALKVGSRLHGRFTIATGKDGLLGLITRQGTYLVLGTDTDLEMIGKGECRVTHGRLYLNNRGDISRIATPAGEIALLGTTIEIKISGKATTAVTVVSGKVKLTNAHGTAIVAAGNRGVLPAQAAPTRGKPVNLQAETAWRDGRTLGQLDSDKIAYMVMRSKYIPEKHVNGKEMTYSSSEFITEIWTMNADGTGKRRIRTYAGFAKPVNCLPHHGMVLVDKNFNYSLLNIATEQESPMKVPEDLSIVGQPTLSPDGKSVAFAARPLVSQNGSGRYLFIYDIRTGRLRKLCPWWGSGGATPHWSPDGRYLAAAWHSQEEWGATRRRVSMIHLVDAASGQDLPAGVKGDSPVFSPDGTKIACRALNADEALPFGGPGKGAIFVVDVKTWERKAVTPLGDGALGPQWSPDGTWILFARREQNADDGASVTSLHIVNADGSKEREIYRGTNQEQRWWALRGDAVFVATYTTTDISYSGKSVLKLALDGSGVIADLGGNEQDSSLTLEEERQLAQVSGQITAANRLGYEASKLLQEGDFDRARVKFRAEADMLAAMIWANPLSGLSLDDLLSQIRRDDELATRTNEQYLEEECRWRIRKAGYGIRSYVSAYGKFPGSLEIVRDSMIPMMKKSGDYDVPRTPENDARITGVFYCPGKDHRDPVLYTFDARGKDSLRADDILISCPNHPNNKLPPDDRLLNKLKGP